MKKIMPILAVLICAAIMLIVTGCSEESTDIAFITSRDTDDVGSSAANCFNGVVSYANENGLSYAEYSGSTDKQIEEAAADGAEVMVLFGVDDENAVYSCAGKYPDIKFICVDFGNDFFVRSNILCLNVSQTQCGIYAGYGAVKEGHLTLGIQGEASAETYNYTRGFIEGAQIAAVEIKVSKKPVKIYYNISGSDMAAERAASWYDNGCKLIFCSDSVYEAVASYVTDTDLHKIMTFGADRTDKEDVVASAYADYSRIVRDYLASACGDDFAGGMMYTAGATDGAAGFSYVSSAFEVLTDSDLDKVTATISNSDKLPADSGVYKTPSDKGYSKIVLSEEGIIVPSDKNE